jgi:hypothetical protein
MLGKCLWLQLNPYHNLNLIISKLSEVFGTNNYSAHITLEYNINESEYHSLKEKYTNFFKKNPILKKYGELYIDKQNEFFTIKQDYISLNSLDRSFYISLAYKNKPFNDSEMNFLKKCKIDDFIYVKDTSIKLWNCNSDYSVDWKQIN